MENIENIGKVARCTPIETQRATFGPNGATGTAPKPQQESIQALADKVLSRNTSRNPTATKYENRRNFDAQKQGQKLRTKMVHSDTKILEKACQDLAIKPTQLWRFLSPEDITDIQNGLIDFETLRAYAERWNAHPYAVPVGNDLPFPEPPKKKTVVCADCQHFKADTIGDGTGIGTCTQGCTGPLGKPLYPKTERYCDTFKRNK